MAKAKQKKKIKKSGLNWEELKEEFFTDQNPDGSYRFNNVEEFAQHVARGDAELYKRVVRSIRWKAYKGYEWQGDWASERLKESGKHDAQVKALHRKLNQEFDLLEIGKDIAQTYVPWQGRVERLFVELDEIYGGRPVLVAPPIPKPSPKLLKKFHMSEAQYYEDAKSRREHQQARRFKDYTRCVSQILRLKKSIDDQVLETLGWNRPQFAMLIKNMHKNGESTGVQETKVVQVMNQLAMMQLKKAEVYGMELPDDFKPAMKALGNGNGHSKVHAEAIETEATEVEDDLMTIPVNGSRKNGSKNGKNGKH